MKPNGTLTYLFNSFAILGHPWGVVQFGELIFLLVFHILFNRGVGDGEPNLLARKFNHSGFIQPIRFDLQLWEDFLCQREI